jgi:hypothetical protein
MKVERKVEDDFFIHFSDREIAKKIVSERKLSVEEGYSNFAVSGVWGAYVPGVQHTHIDSDDIVAVMFKTDTVPSIGHVEEVTWDKDVILIGPKIIELAEAALVLRDTPESMMELDSEASDGPEFDSLWISYDSQGITSRKASVKYFMKLSAHYSNDNQLNKINSEPSNVSIFSDENHHLMGRPLKVASLWRAASLEYGTEERAETPDSLYDLFGLSTDIRDRIHRLEELNRLSMNAYEDESPDAEALDVEYAEAEEELGNMMDEIGFEGESNTGGSDVEHQHQSRDLNELMLEFSKMHFAYLMGQSEHRSKSYLYEDAYDGGIPQLVERLRGLAKSYGYSNGSLKEDVTDEQLLSAAKDSYDVIRGRRGKYKDSFLTGYKIVGRDKRGLFSLQNPEIRYPYSGGRNDNMISHPSGVYIGTSEEFVVDYYSGLTDSEEAILKLKYKPEDVILGNPDEEGEVIVSAAIINDIKMEYRNEWSISHEDLLDE